MGTARSVVEQAAKDGGVLGLGQTLNSIDVNDIFLRLQNMVSQWQKRRWLQPSLFDIAMPGNNAVSNQIGDGQYWNTPRPDKIRAAYFTQGSNNVSFPLWPFSSYENYAAISLKRLNSWPTRYFYDGAFPYGNVFIWPIPTSSYTIHLIIPSQLGFSTTITDGDITAAGSGYTNGVYLAVPLLNLVASQNGLSATANVTVAAGIITAFAIQNGGELYKVNDTLTLDTTVVGVGTGFVYTVTETESNLDSEMSFPSEYDEAIIANLAIRVCIMYQMEASADLKKLARTSLKTIVAANTQIPTLRMPGTLGRRRAGIANVDGGVVLGDVA